MLWAGTIGTPAFTVRVPLAGAPSDRIGRTPLPVFSLMVDRHAFAIIAAAQPLFSVALSLD
jgi:hypothetical protein